MIYFPAAALSICICFGKVLHVTGGPNIDWRVVQSRRTCPTRREIFYFVATLKQATLRPHQQLTVEIRSALLVHQRPLLAKARSCF
ncbi:hypothetical protein BD289DRAFT_27202 [Coniella lustricola]|uniref:Secreted protein n=1 Tax=Coniella lustricola TaxID=2025994 RepID=A0A2T3A2Y9_9PEZI|nr:hypothetical protein BD289DRAFT_27202 [Coniella lustricola]